MTLSISNLQTTLLDKIFKSTSSRSTDPTDGGGIEGLALETLSPQQQSQKLMAEYAFKDFVQHFLDLEKKSEQLAKAMATMPGHAPGPLYAKPLHLNIEIERYSQLGGDGSTGGQPVSVQKAKNDNAATSRIEIRTPVVHADGVVSYNITVVKLAVSIEDMQPRPDLAQGSVLSQPLVTASGSVVGDNLEDFFNDSPFDAETVWEFEHTDAMELIEQEEKMYNWHQEKAMKLLMEAAYNVVKYMQAQKISEAFELTDEDEALMAEALTSGNLTDTTRKAIISFLKKKKIELEMVRKEQAERQEAAENAHEIAGAQDARQKMINTFDRIIQQMEQQQIDPGVLAGLLDEVARINLSQAPTDGGLSVGAAAVGAGV